MTRDEFGGYCCKRWGELPTSATKSTGKSHDNDETTKEEDICKLLGLDIDKSALEIVKADFKRKKIPLSKAGKYLSVTNPHSAHSSAVKSYNASASKSVTKPTLNSTSGKGNTTPSAFLNYEGNIAPYKRSRIDSHTFG